MKYLLDILVFAALMLFGIALMAMLAERAKSHEWYDEWCCSSDDCAPAEVQWLPDGRIKATTKFGTAIFGLDAQIRQSKDGQWHACIPPWAVSNESKARCLYAPGMM